MMKITNLKELNKRKILNFEDIIVFTINKEKIEYEVDANYLHNRIYSNEYIFKILKLNKIEFTETHYGYNKRRRTINDEYWPEYKNNDYEAITRVVKELYKIIGEKDPTIKPEPILSRFEIMDL